MRQSNIKPNPAKHKQKHQTMIKREAALWPMVSCQPLMNNMPVLVLPSPCSSGSAAEVEGRGRAPLLSVWQKSLSFFLFVSPSFPCDCWCSALFFSPAFFPPSSFFLPPPPPSLCSSSAVFLLAPVPSLCSSVAPSTFRR